MQNPYSQKAHILTVCFLRHTSLQLECTYPYSALLDAHILTVRSLMHTSLQSAPYRWSTSDSTPP